MMHKSVSLADQVYERLEKDILSGKYTRGTILTELRLCEDLGVSRTPVREALRMLEQEHVAVVPGTAFGDCGEGFLRISYAYSVENLKRALDRLREFIEKLRAEKFFDSLYPHFIFISMNATECFSEEDMIDFVIRMNGKENCTDYIENIEAFF